MPAFILASVPDNDFVLVLCRDIDLQNDGTFLRMPVSTRTILIASETLISAAGLGRKNPSLANEGLSTNYGSA